MLKKISFFMTLLVALSLVLSACAQATATQAPVVQPTTAPVVEPTTAPVVEPTDAPVVEPTDAPVVEPTAAPTDAPAEPPAGEKVTIRWFIGLGAGGNPEEITKEEAFVAAFNEKYGDHYELVMDVVQNETAYDVLKTQIASGDVPDIVGPVGVRGLWSFEGAWMDLSPYIEKYQYDLSDFNPALIDFYKLGPMGQVGLPFAVYPSALWYNVDLFDEAGLEYPPHEFGAAYADGDEWTFDKLKELAMTLTVDANGNDANSADFDPDNITQFGYNAQWTDIRGQWTFFGAGSFADADGNAVMPDVWREAMKWYYNGIWTDHFIPNDNYVNSDLLAQGNVFSSGNVAMVPIHTWYTCCFGEVNWDLAAIPSYNGNITAKLHADTFAILKGAKNPDASFEVLSLMLGEFAQDLLVVYNGFPARASLQDSAVAKMQEAYPNADLQVFLDALNYPDNPNHESGMPNFSKASDRYGTFGSMYQSTPDLDLDAEIDKLLADLQAIFDEVK